MEYEVGMIFYDPSDGERLQVKTVITRARAVLTVLNSHYQSFGNEREWYFPIADILEAGWVLCESTRVRSILKHYGV